jgi:hypothetical protein
MTTLQQFRAGFIAWKSYTYLWVRINDGKESEMLLQLTEPHGTGQE